MPQDAPCGVCGQIPEVVGYDEEHGTELVRCGCMASLDEAADQTRFHKVGTGVAGILKLQNFWDRSPK